MRFLIHMLSVIFPIFIYIDHSYAMFLKSGEILNIDLREVKHITLCFKS